MNCIRNAANSSKVGEVTVEKDGPHAYSLPLTGAVYDVFVDEFESRKSPADMREALEGAREYLGALLARTWSSHLSADNLRYSKVRKAVIEADWEMGGGRKKLIDRNFRNRGIQ